MIQVERIDIEDFGCIRLVVIEDSPMFCLYDLCKVLNLNDSAVIDTVMENTLSHQCVHIEGAFFVDTDVSISLCCVSDSTKKDSVLAALKYYDFVFVYNMIDKNCSFDFWRTAINKLLEISKKERHTSIYTYIAYDENRSLYKVGKTKDLGKRIRNILTYIQTITPIFVLEGDFEKEIHSQLESSRVFKEWFDISKEDLLNTREKYRDFIILDTSNKSK